MKNNSTGTDNNRSAACRECSE